MGNECKVCRKRNPEEEIILNAPIQKNNQSETLENSQSYTKYLTFKEIINSNPEHYKKLHKIKKALLSYQKRQIYKNMLKKFHESQKTFLYEEYIETYQTQKHYHPQKKNLIIPINTNQEQYIQANGLVDFVMEQAQ